MTNVRQVASENALWNELGRGEPTLLILENPQCPYCKALRNQLGAIGDALRNKAQVLVFDGKRAKQSLNNNVFMGRLQLFPTLLFVQFDPADRQFDSWVEYGRDAPRTPQALRAFVEAEKRLRD